MNIIIMIIMINYLLLKHKRWWDGSVAEIATKASPQVSLWIEAGSHCIIVCHNNNYYSLLLINVLFHLFYFIFLVMVLIIM